MRRRNYFSTIGDLIEYYSPFMVLILFSGFMIVMYFCEGCLKIDSTVSEIIGLVVIIAFFIVAFLIIPLILWILDHFDETHKKKEEKESTDVVPIPVPVRSFIGQYRMVHLLGKKRIPMIFILIRNFLFYWMLLIRRPIPRKGRNYIISFPFYIKKRSLFQKVFGIMILQHYRSLLKFFWIPRKMYQKRSAKTWKKT